MKYDLLMDERAIGQMYAFENGVFTKNWFT